MKKYNKKKEKKSSPKGKTQHKRSIENATKSHIIKIIDDNKDLSLENKILF